MESKSSTVQEVMPEVGQTFTLDESVIAALPPGTKILKAISYGASAWTRAARVSTESPDGETKDYFLKCATESIGRTMAEAEYNSLLAIHELIPTFAPKPYAWGAYKSSPPETYFVLLDFLDLRAAEVDPGEFCSELARLHSTSVSPTGKFGFHVTTCHGPNWQNTKWEDSWFAYFTRLLTQFFSREIKQNGSWKEYEDAFAKLSASVVPQLLIPLQSEGRHLKPCLVHGDLWEENLGTNLNTGKPVVFDPSVMYAHNEYEIGMWRRDIVRMSKVHVRKYLAEFPPSEPARQWDDRNRLYSIKFNLAHAIALPATKDTVRELIFDDMRYLLEKYGDGTNLFNLTSSLEKPLSTADGILPPPLETYPAGSPAVENKSVEEEMTAEKTSAGIVAQAT